MPYKENEQEVGWNITAVSVVRKTKDVFLFNTGLQIQPPHRHATEIIPSPNSYHAYFDMSPSTLILHREFNETIVIPMRYHGWNDFTDEIGGLSSVPLEVKRAQALVGQPIAKILFRKLADDAFDFHDVTDYSKETK